MAISSGFNLNLPETPKGVPDELFNEFRRLYSALRNIVANLASNTRIEGFVTLVAGTKVINNSQVAANSRIILTIQQLGTVAVPKAIGVTSRIVGTSFTITSADATDTSVVAWSFLP